MGVSTTSDQSWKSSTGFRYVHECPSNWRRSCTRYVKRACQRTSRRVSRTTRPVETLGRLLNNSSPLPGHGSLPRVEPSVIQRPPSGTIYHFTYDSVRRSEHSGVISRHIYSQPPMTARLVLARLRMAGPHTAR